MQPETIISEEKIFKGKVIDLDVRQVSLVDGTQVSREIIINKGAVVIIPITRNNEVRLVRQYRAAAEKWVIELPAGGLEPGEDPDLAAPRELLEETGDQAANWQICTASTPRPAFSPSFCSFTWPPTLHPAPTAWNLTNT